MKLVTYTYAGATQLGIIQNDNIWPTQQLNSALPNNMLAFLQGGESIMELAKTIDQQLKINPNLAEPI
jgi:fumarylacetoacetate (FAA) hydrolase